jgi:hypothetical protein
MVLGWVLVLVLVLLFACGGGAELAGLIDHWARTAGGGVGQQR